MAGEKGLKRDRIHDFGYFTKTQKVQSGMIIGDKETRLIGQMYYVIISILTL